MENMTKVNEKIDMKALEKGDAIIGKNAFVLDNGNVLANLFGKYMPSLTFIIEDTSFFNYVEDKELEKDLNIEWDGSPTFMFGRYWEKKKKDSTSITRCFAPCERSKATHMLIDVDWGGCFNTTSGKITGIGALHYRRACSNGGGAGSTFLVYPINFRHVHLASEYEPEKPSPKVELVFQRNPNASNLNNEEREDEIYHVGFEFRELFIFGTDADEAVKEGKFALGHFETVVNRGCVGIVPIFDGIVFHSYEECYDLINSSDYNASFVYYI